MFDEHVLRPGSPCTRLAPASKCPALFPHPAVRRLHRHGSDRHARAPALLARRDHCLHERLRRRGALDTERAQRQCVQTTECCRDFGAHRRRHPADIPKRARRSARHAPCHHEGAAEHARVRLDPERCRHRDTLPGQRDEQRIFLRHARPIASRIHANHHRGRPIRMRLDLEQDGLFRVTARNRVDRAYGQVWRPWETRAQVRLQPRKVDRSMRGGVAAHRCIRHVRDCGLELPPHYTIRREDAPSSVRMLAASAGAATGSATNSSRTSAGKVAS